MGLFQKEKIQVTIQNDLNAPVQKMWLFSLPWKMQTVINQALRAPDTHFCPKIKILCRWLRSVVLNNADNGHTFMCSKNSIPKWEDIENEFNYCSVHFATHFLYAFEIIGYKHPDSEVKEIAFNLYSQIVRYSMHLNVETEKEMDGRLCDIEKVPKLFDVIKVTTETKPVPCPINDRYIRR
jgi:hypothetical protein